LVGRYRSSGQNEEQRKPSDSVEFDLNVDHVGFQ